MKKHYICNLASPLRPGSEWHPETCELFFKQIADMPQNRDCLSWDGVKGKKEKKDVKKAWERKEGGKTGTERWTGGFEIVQKKFKIREAEER